MAYVPLKLNPKHPGGDISIAHKAPFFKLGIFSILERFIVPQQCIQVPFYLSIADLSTEGHTCLNSRCEC